MSANKTTKVECFCGVCGIDFLVPLAHFKQGVGKYCSELCRNTTRAIPLKERFLRHIGHPTESGCTLWTSCLNTNGYGIFPIRLKGQRRQRLLTHRVAWEFLNGPIPTGLLVCHKCDVPACVNVNHLFLGTQADNVLDMMLKNRQGRSIITAEAVRLIRTRYAEGGISQQQLADEYGIKQTNVSMIVNGHSWVHVT